MEISQVKEAVEKNYDIKVLVIDKIKNVYKINTDKGEYCLKTIKYNYKHFIFITSAMMHLKRKGFENILPFIMTNEGKTYIKILDKYAYLTVWIQCRQCNYNNDLDIVLATSTLAKLHKKSEGFIVTKEMEPRIGWFKWIETYKTRTNEILNFKKIIDLKNKKTEFDDLYINMMQEEIERANKSIADIICTQYLNKMKEEIEKRGFCHHDYAHHNVLVQRKNKVNVIDFDYCMLDTHLHDIASILIRRMKNEKWDMNSAIFILDVYNDIKKIERVEIPIMASFMEFPQDYWQVGIQYYWEKQPWEQEFFINKLKRINKDKKQKQEFIEDFMTYKYEGV